jgi:hypothetical protein
LVPSVLPLLQRDGWTHIKRFFATNHRNRQRSIYRPHTTGEPTIFIPCFINNNHWTALVRRELNGRVLFLYADDMNCPSTEASIQRTFHQQTDPSFYPPATEWITCHTTTYSPHSNECGPRTLLARSIMALHPSPSSSILLPYMHHNLAQITRAWASITLLKGIPILPPIASSNSHTLAEQAARSIIYCSPPNLIDWTSNTTTKCNDTEKVTTTSPCASLHIPKSFSARPPAFTPLKNVTTGEQHPGAADKTYSYTSTDKPQQSPLSLPAATGYPIAPSPEALPLP